MPWGSWDRSSLAAEAYDGLERPVPTRFGEGDEPGVVREPRHALRDGGWGRYRDAVARPPRLIAGEPHLRQERQRVRQRHDPLLVGVGDVERPDPGPPQLDAVRVAEVGHQRSHVGPGRALDRERSPA